ncbi:MAG: UbiA family prenyltransferase [Nitrososphaerota archaeon]|nr:UbiA family prenyltransferase [Candidatus Bathyarchaeota archaeon]MDW8048259.1 UbiA family prenyltransferase [Nitrososphaerota archaeon]
MNFFLSLCVYVYNNIVDVELDRLNPQKKNRPHASGAVAKEELMVFVYTTALIAFGLSILIGFNMLLLSLLWFS